MSIKKEVIENILIIIDRNDNDNHIEHEMNNLIILIYQL